MPDSFDYTTGTNSENVRLLQALIDDAPEYTEETNSRNANILKSIINNTEYTDAPQSEIEELLLRLKAKIGGEIEVDELNVTENGTYDAGVNKAYNPVNVELPLSSKTITENGTYTASDDNLAGYDEVTVAVEGYAKKSIANTPTPIATFNASTLPMPSLTVGIEAVQSGSGDPSPTNIRPITGWSAVDVTRTSINIWDEETELGTYNNTTGEKQNSTTLTRCKNPIKVNPSSECYLNIGSTSALNILQFDEKMNYLGSSTLIQNTTSRAFTVTENTYYIVFYFLGTTYNNDISINYPSTDTSYHAYNGTTTSISLGETVYNAELDVINGEGTSGYYSYTFTGNESGGDYGGVGFYLRTGVPKAITQGGMCEFCTMRTTTANPQVNEGVIANGSAGVVNVAFNLDGITTLDDLKTLVAGKKILLKLASVATSETFTTTPTQISTIQGINNLWADSGDVLSGEYFEEL